MKHIFVFCSFLLFSVHVLAQSPLAMPQSGHRHVSDFLKHLPISGLPQVESRNFVELQLDSVITTSFDSLGVPSITGRHLYSYSADTVKILTTYYFGFGTNPSSVSQTKIVYNDNNLVTYTESRALIDGELSAPTVEWLYYNPVFPSALDSIRFYWVYTDGVNDPVTLFYFTYASGTGLLTTEVQKLIENNELAVIGTTLYEYDNQEREVLKFSEFLSFGDLQTTLNRSDFVYFTDTVVETNSSKIINTDTSWVPQFRATATYNSGSPLKRSNEYSHWDNLTQDWSLGWIRFYHYDAESRLVLEQINVQIDSILYHNGQINSYVQENYYDRMIYYYFDTNGDSIVTSISQYYYALPSSTTQPNAKTAQVELAPNPAHAYLHARTEQNIQLAELYDLQGRLVLNIATEGTNVLHVHRNNLPSGTYVLRLQLENGATVSERVQWE